MISIVIPVHNERLRLSRCLESLEEFRKTFPDHLEVIMVENGSIDITYNLALEKAVDYPWLRVLRFPHRGKGGAVQLGMSRARGELRMMMDVDLAMPPEAIYLFLTRVMSHPVVIGSRRIPGATRRNGPASRQFSGRVFSSLINLLLPEIGVSDTQCGFKMFTDKAAIDIFSRLKIYGLAFDVEVLALARTLGYPIAEIPIPWFHNRDSRIRMIEDSITMFRDILQIHQNIKLLKPQLQKAAHKSPG